MKKILILPIIAVLLSVLAFSINDSYAITSITLDATSCPIFGGIWNSLTSTCKISTNTNSISKDTELKIPSGTKLVVSNAANVGIDNFGTITNSGTIVVSNTANTGIANLGTITNSGTIVVGGKFVGSIENSGPIINSGTITISSPTGDGLFNNFDGTIINSGTITISNKGSFSQNFINSAGTIINSGTITISNKGNFSKGIPSDKYSTINNTSGGNITIENSGDFSVGIQSSGTLFYNAGSITVSNTGTNSTGIFNNGKLINTGTISKFCGGKIIGKTTVNPVIDLCNRTFTNVTPSPASASAGLKFTFKARVTDTSTTEPRTIPNGTINWDDGGKGGTFKLGGIVTNMCTLSPVNATASSCTINYINNPANPVNTLINITGTYSGESTHHTSHSIAKLTIK